MTMVAVGRPRLKGYLIEFLLLLAINVPTVSFGLALGWVSLVSGEGGEGVEGGDGVVVGAAAATFAAGLLGVPLGAYALRFGRKPALIATSAAFVVCWSLKLVGGWCVVGGRIFAGAAGAAAWTIVPLLATEMCSSRMRGAAAAALVSAHNLGVVGAYLAADHRLHHRTVEWCCLALSATHCGAFLLAPESPAFLAAQGKLQEARAALAWLRGVRRDHPALDEELRALPTPHPTSPALSPLKLFKDMLSSRGRRWAFLVSLVAVVGQEACGVLTVLQFAERVFMLTRAGREDDGLPSPARLALLLGLVQLITSLLALYLVERVGRRPLLAWCAVATGAGLAAGAGWARAERAGAAAGALAAAVAADSLGLQPAPYAILGDMFSYQYLGCAVSAVTLAASVANAAETVVFPAITHAAGLWPALVLAACLTLSYAVFVIIYVPETKGRTPQEIYDLICPPRQDTESGDKPRDNHTKHIANTPIDTHNDKNASTVISELATDTECHNVIPIVCNGALGSKTAINTAACKLTDDVCRPNLRSTGDVARDTKSEEKSNIICDTIHNVANSKSMNSIINHKVTEESAINQIPNTIEISSICTTDADPARKIHNVMLRSDVICPKTNCDVTGSSVLTLPLQSSHNNEHFPEETQCTKL